MTSDVITTEINRKVKMDGGPHETVVDAAVKRLIQRIREGDLPPNSRLPSQRSLAEQLSVSYATLREAMSVLTTLGYIRVEPNRGTYIRAIGDREPQPTWRFIDQYSQRDIYEARHVLESYTARLAALGHSEEGLRGLEESLGGLKRAARELDLLAFAEHDFNFHNRIVVLSGNVAVGEMLRTLKDAMRESQRLPLAKPSQLWETISEHEKILNAIKHSDPEGAAYLMQLHITKAAGRANVTLRI